jgi:hypothetical protein
MAVVTVKNQDETCMPVRLRRYAMHCEVATGRRECQAKTMRVRNFIDVSKKFYAKRNTTFRRVGDGRHILTFVCKKAFFSEVKRLLRSGASVSSPAMAWILGAAKN